MFNFAYITALRAEITALKDDAVEAFNAISQLVALATNGPSSS